MGGAGPIGRHRGAGKRGREREEERRAKGIVQPKLKFHPFASLKRLW